MLEPHEFAISEAQNVAPSDLIEQEVWNGIVHLPEDVSLTKILVALHGRGEVGA